MSEQLWKIILSLVLLASITIWITVLYYPDKDLHVISCDVGQGDGIIITQGKLQLLIDGGPDNSIINCLDSHLPFWDRTIEMVILTHPDKDHFVGLIEVFKRFKVERFLVNELDPGVPEYRVLEEIVGGGDTLVIRPKKGMSIRWGLIHLDILHPSDEFSQSNFDEEYEHVVHFPHFDNELGMRSSSKDNNDFSTVIHLQYGEFDALFTGDIGPDVMDIVLQSDIRDVEYLQVPHHGSRNGLTKELLERSTPEIAVISAGKNNPHGHPHKEVLDLLTESGVKILRTDEMGDIIIRTDGEMVYLE